MNSRNNILDELKTIAPRLAEIERANCFAVPVHYFETAATEILQKVKTESTLSTLDALKNDNPFNVPYNYFESLPNKILNRVREEENKISWLDNVINKLSVLLKPQYATAAIFLTFGIIFFATKIGQKQVNIPSLAAAEKQVSTSDVSNYIQSNIDQFDEKSISEYVSNEQLDNAPFPMKSIDTMNINNQNLIDISQFDDNTIKEIAN